MDRKLLSYTCKKCGVVFNSYGHLRVLLCEKCKKKQCRENDRIRKKQNYDNFKKPIKRQVIKKDGKSISQIIKELEEYNRNHKTLLSYGQYVARFL